jgi:hypothetical protein
VIYLDQAAIELLLDNFYKDPTLALAYNHCCFINLHAAIFNERKYVQITYCLGVLPTGFVHYTGGAWAGETIQRQWEKSSFSPCAASVSRGGWVTTLAVRGLEEHFFAV